MYRKLLSLFLIFMTSFVLISCRDGQAKTKIGKKTILTVTKSPTFSMLYFSGNLQPYKQTNITSPTDGGIIVKKFSYGQFVKKGVLLFVVKSSKIRKDFETALTAYLKAKEDLNHQVANFQNTASLYKDQLVSRDEYTQASNSFYLSQLSLLQAKITLKNLVKYFPEQSSVFSLSIKDIKRITSAFSNDKKVDNISIYSSAGGIVLFPQKSSGGAAGGSDIKKVGVGSIVKQGQLLVSIGSEKNLSLEAKANEININQLKVGLKANITSVAFPGITLKGKITSIDNQATGTGPIPQFNIVIKINDIPKSARKLIRIGMSAKVSLQIKQAAAIQIPISAFSYNDVTNQATVELINPETNKPKTQVITTGKTLLTKVIVYSGLKVGDKIVY